MLVKLTKIDSKNENLRTKEIIGEAQFMPELGRSFIMFTDPIDEEKDYRQITTSAVKSMTKTAKNKIVFKTMNSTYELEFLD